MTAAERDKIRRAVIRAERFCDREKAIQLVVMNSRYSFAEVLRAMRDEPNHGGEWIFTPGGQTIWVDA